VERTATRAGGFDDGGFWVLTKHRGRVVQPGKDCAAAVYKDGTVGGHVEQGKFVLLNMGLKPISKPERLRSGWLNGIKHWQVDYHGGSGAKYPCGALGI
jgi:hypothetical protein